MTVIGQPRFNSPPSACNSFMASHQCLCRSPTSDDIGPSRQVMASVPPRRPRVPSRPARRRRRTTVYHFLHGVRERQTRNGARPGTTPRPRCRRHGPIPRNRCRNRIRRSRAGDKPTSPHPRHGTTNRPHLPSVIWHGLLIVGRGRCSSARAHGSSATRDRWYL